MLHQGKTIGPAREVMAQGLDKDDQLLPPTMTAYSLIRLQALGPLRAQRAP
jgi:hypothetical protein